MADSQATFRANEVDLSKICAEILARINTNRHIIFLLQGDIGAGKTTLVKAFAKQIGISDSVTSPTFSLLHIYGSLNSSLGASFALAENFGRSQTPSLVSRPNFSTNTKSPPQILELDSKADSTKSSLRGRIADSHEAIQTNQSRVSATESRPIRGAKNRIQGCSSATADFLLESDKRGSPPKSEKRQLLARRGSGAGGAALLREKTNESNTKSVDCFGDKSPRNDEKFLKIYHYDLFNRALGELLDLGLLDLLEQSGIHFVEWGDSQLFGIIKNAFENICIISIHKTKNARIYEFKESF